MLDNNIGPTHRHHFDFEDRQRKRLRFASVQTGTQLQQKPRWILQMLELFSTINANTCLITSSSDTSPILGSPTPPPIRASTTASSIWKHAPPNAAVCASTLFAVLRIEAQVSNSFVSDGVTRNQRWVSPVPGQFRSNLAAGSYCDGERYGTRQLLC